MAEALRAVGARVELQASAAQQWIHLMPAGTWMADDGRGPFRIDDAAAVIAASVRDDGRALPVDYDHALVFGAPKGTPAPASGWIERLEARQDGIWGLVDWTERAGAALKAREYRYISPMFAHAKDGLVVRIEGAGLTNMPAFGNLAAVASKEDSMTLEQLLADLRKAFGLKADADAPAVTAAAAATAAAAKAAGQIATAAGLAETAKPEEIAKAVASLEAGGSTAAIATAAGLAETARPEEIVAAVAALKTASAAAPDPARFVPIEEHRALAAKVTKLEQDDAAEKATAAVDAAVKAGKITPAGREWALGYAQKDPEGFATFAKAQPVIVAPGELAAFAGKPPQNVRVTAAQAQAYQDEQRAKGINVTTLQAFAHLEKGAAA